VHPSSAPEFHLRAGKSTWANGYLDGMLNIEITGVLRIPPSLVSGQQCRARRFRKCKPTHPLRMPALLTALPELARSGLHR